jgi:alpha-tubulin suppressor-like RCC1 family protein
MSDVGEGSRTGRVAAVGIAAVLLVLGVCSAADAQFKVTAGGYTIDGATNPPLPVVRGRTYTFEINTPNHPFFIEWGVIPSGATTPTWTRYSGASPVSPSNGVQVGTMTFTVPSNAPSLLRYICGMHSWMTGNFSVSDPPPPKKTPGQSCGATSECESGLTCVSGVCCRSSSCAWDQCHAGTCGGDGNCTVQPNGFACNDGNACTRSDTCQGGGCNGANPVVCIAKDQCHVKGTCNTGTGTCSDPNATNGTGCNDGLYCTTPDVCTNGVCGGPARSCSADACHDAGVCDNATASCSSPAKADGTDCTADSNVCTDDVCQSGSCAHPNSANGATCDDGNTGTAADQCNGAGSCGGDVDPGNLWLWGQDASGQIGDGRSGTGVVQSTPYVIASPKNFVQLAAGKNHACALAVDGTVWTWGKNDRGQLGDPSWASATRNAPARVGLGGSAIAVAAGDDHCLALLTTGEVMSWGDDRWGQLGDGVVTSTPQPAPRLVSGMHDVTGIAAGARHSAAVRTEGIVWSWGDNAQGQIGDRSAPSTVPYHATPVRSYTPGSGYFKAVACGAEHTIALGFDGLIQAWGSNRSNALAQPSNVAYSSTPVNVNLPQRARAIGAGGDTSLVVLADGSVAGWGDNSQGELGHPGATAWAYPVPVDLIGDVLQVATGSAHSLALRADGTVWTWGSNASAQLGDAAFTTPTAQPRQLTALHDIASVSAGAFFSAAVQAQGTVVAFGINTSGKLGRGLSSGTLGYSADPGFVLGLRAVKAVSAGCSHNLALLADGTVWSWGRNGEGQLGVPGHSYESAPVEVTDLGDRVTAIAAGCNHSLALLANGQLTAWGYGGRGALGTGGNSSATRPISVPGMSNVIVIAAFEHSMAIQADGLLQTWGYNNHYQLGRTSGAMSPGPVLYPQTTNLIHAAVIAAGRWASYAVSTTGGDVYAWGGGGFGELGDQAGSSNRDRSGFVYNLGSVRALSAGEGFVLALANGIVFGWGDNSYGQLGSAAANPSKTRVEMPAGGYIGSMSAGFSTTYMQLPIYDMVFGQGRGTHGALGNGTTANSPYFVVVNSSRDALNICGGNEAGLLLLQ